LVEWLLAGEENREALLGDFAEAGLTAGEQLQAALGLVARRQAEAWKRPGPWAVLFALLPVYANLPGAVTAGVQVLATRWGGDDWLRYGSLGCALSALYSGVAGIVNARLAGKAGGVTRWLLPAAGVSLMPVFNFAITDGQRLAATCAAQMLVVVGCHELGWRSAARGGGGELWRSVGAAALLVGMLLGLGQGRWPRGWEAVGMLAWYWPFVYWIVNNWNKKRRTVVF
jgi:hypothetical protein